MALVSGDLTNVGVPELFRAIADEQRTGRLSLSRANGDRPQVALIYFREGDAYHARLIGSGVKLGARLVSAGLVSSQDLEAALRTQMPSSQRRRLGELLIEWGLVAREQLESIIREQIEDTIFEVLRWGGGNFTFESDTETDEDVVIGVSVENLVMEGARRFREWHHITRRIPTLEAIPRLDDQEEGAIEVALTPEEWAFVSRMDGRRSIARLAGDCGFTDLEAARTAFGLVTAGLITIDLPPGMETPEEEDLELQLAELERAISEAATARAAGRVATKLEELSGVTSEAAEAVKAAEPVKAAEQPSEEALADVDALEAAFQVGAPAEELAIEAEELATEEVPALEGERPEKFWAELPVPELGSAPVEPVETVAAEAPSEEVQEPEVFAEPDLEDHFVPAQEVAGVPETPLDSFEIQEPAVADEQPAFLAAEPAATEIEEAPFEPVAGIEEGSEALFDLPAEPQPTEAHELDLEGGLAAAIEPEAVLEPEVPAAIEPEAILEPEAPAAIEPEAILEPEVPAAIEPEAILEPEVPAAIEPEAILEPELPAAVEPEAILEPELPAAVEPEPAVAGKFEAEDLFDQGVEEEPSEVAAMTDYFSDVLGPVSTYEDFPSSADIEIQAADEIEETVFQVQQDPDVPEQESEVSGPAQPQPDPQTYDQPPQQAQEPAPPAIKAHSFWGAVPQAPPETEQAGWDQQAEGSQDETGSPRIRRTVPRSIDPMDHTSAWIREFSSLGEDEEDSEEPPPEKPERHRPKHRPEEKRGFFGRRKR